MTGRGISRLRRGRRSESGSLGARGGRHVLAFIAFCPRPRLCPEDSRPSGGAPAPPIWAIGEPGGGPRRLRDRFSVGERRIMRPVFHPLERQESPNYPAGFANVSPVTWNARHIVGDGGVGG